MGRLHADSLTQTLALHVVRHYSVSRRAPEMFRGGLSGYNLRRAKDFINDHLEQDLTLAVIAEFGLGLAVLNLVPLPPLDGGRVLFCVLEKIYRPTAKVEAPVTLVGWALVMVLMVCVTVQDVERIVA